MNIYPFITKPGDIWDSDEARAKIAAALPKPHEGKIWRHRSLPGWPLRFSKQEDAVAWMNSFVDGRATIEPNLVMPVVGVNIELGLEWKTNPEYEAAQFEVCYIVEELL